MIVKFCANVPSHSWNSVRVIVCLFALMTKLFRLNEYLFAPIESVWETMTSILRKISFKKEFFQWYIKTNLKERTKNSVPSWKSTVKTVNIQSWNSHASFVSLYCCQGMSGSLVHQSLVATGKFTTWSIAAKGLLSDISKSIGNVRKERMSLQIREN